MNRTKTEFAYLGFFLSLFMSQIFFHYSLSHPCQNCPLLWTLFCKHMLLLGKSVSFFAVIITISAFSLSDNILSRLFEILINVT